eukprot:5911153-Pleurochrysis_carterae.AAC.9
MRAIAGRCAPSIARRSSAASPSSTTTAREHANAANRVSYGSCRLSCRAACACLHASLHCGFLQRVDVCLPT